MTVSFLKYPLQDGFIHNWLTVGPQVIQVDSSPALFSPKEKEKISRSLYTAELEIDTLPVERGELSEGIFATGEFQDAWRYTPCLEDHLVNHSGIFTRPCYLRSWAYTQLVSSDEMEAQLRIAAPGPVDIWVNHKHLLHSGAFFGQRAGQHFVDARLSKGANKIAVRFENLAYGSGELWVALQVRDTQGVPLATGEANEGRLLHVQVPTAIMPRLIDLRNRMEELFARLRLERDVFERNQDIAIIFPDEEPASEVVTVRLKTSANVIMADGVVDGKPGLRRKICTAFELVGGRYLVELLPRVNEYYESNMRIRKEIALWTVGNAPHSPTSYGSFADRRKEGLLKAVEQRDNVFAEMAKMALGWWKRIEPQVIMGAAARVNRQEQGCVVDLAGLLGLLLRYGQRPEFPVELRQSILTCAATFPYSVGYREESGCAVEDILVSTCECLAGQHLNADLFPQDGLSGEAHFQRGASQAATWLRERGVTGFQDWGSSEELARGLLALSMLVDFAADEALQELAMVVMDKFFFHLSTNTFQGIIGSAQRSILSTDIKGGLLQACSPVTRLMWGAGVFNHRIEALVSLALMENYQLPPLIARIASDTAEEAWSREQHASCMPGNHGGQAPANKATYCTPDAMLSSVQNYFPGQHGAKELVWQATLGAGAVVFVNAPGCAFTDEGMYPSFWVGNVSLPRVAQWKGSLAAVYDLPEQNWMGFTHAYYPTQAFDEYTLRGSWAFARKGNGYLALIASTGVELVTRGEHAYRELRAPGRQVVWVCHVGRASMDGDFVSFQEKIIHLPIRFEALWVEFTTPRGERMSFGSTEPLLLNGEEVPLENYPHYENRYSVTPMNSNLMDIAWGEDVLRLDFSNPPAFEADDPAS